MTKQTQKQNNGRPIEENLANEAGNDAPIQKTEIWEEPPPEGGLPPEVKMGRSDDIRRLSTALAHAQGEIINAKKTSENPHFDTSYAALDAVFDVLRLPLSRHQIARYQIPGFTETEVWLDTMLVHGPSGQYISCRWPIPKGATNKSQDFMAAMTYAKRGSIMAICGVAAEEEDDDGETERRRSARDEGDEPGRPEKPATLTKNQREGIQWAEWALRKVPQLQSREEMSAWEEKYRESLTGLQRVVPDHHKQVMDAIAKRNEELTPATGEEPAGGG